MTVLCSISLLGSVAALRHSEQKSVQEFVRKFVANPAHPSLSLERITKTKDKGLWSARITKELRAVLHRSSDTWTVLYAGHHDEAYAWAERRILEIHAKTGAWQIVEDPSLLPEFGSPVTASKKCLFVEHGDDYLLSLGLPNSWLPTIRKIVDEEALLDVATHLPAEVAERLLDLASGKLVTPAVLDTSSSLDEESKRRFFVIQDSEELIKILEAPLEKWIAFLHPTQRKIAYGNFTGPVKVTGSAGTGKTVVGMHRTKFFAKQNKTVLLTSYGKTLCENIERSLKLLCTVEETERIVVSTVHAQALKILKEAKERVRPVAGKEIERILRNNHSSECPLSYEGLKNEWSLVIQAQGIRSWAQYSNCSRQGRGRPLPLKDRRLVWEIFEQVFSFLKANELDDWSGLCQRARYAVESGASKAHFDAVIVDEVQDLNQQELRFLSSLVSNKDLMLLGDGGQRIYNNKFSLRALGIPVAGRSFTLRLNYRTTDQIRKFADQLLPNEGDDLDGGTERRDETKSLLRGPKPHLQAFETLENQYVFVARTVQQLVRDGLPLNEIAIFGRTKDSLELLTKVLSASGLRVRSLEEERETSADQALNIGTMHRAKGLEFKTVFVIDTSAENIPLGLSSNRNVDEVDVQESLERERNLLYVSVTRARDEAYITWCGKPSPFLRADF